MNQSKIEAGQPGQEPTNEQNAELLPSAQVSANANVMRRFSRIKNKLCQYLITQQKLTVIKP